ncbi:MAG: methyltransferase domain-containing protein [Agathobacter sp.]|nr:methyltransferase domain-containing protein [Agathobacter sp.]
MDAYTSFAEVYDLFMDNVPYEEWADYMIDIFAENEVRDGIMLDLGCGTGKLARLFANRGFDMIGVDNSMDMLEIAKQAQVEEADSTILYLCQDMREFELYGTVRGIYSACDCLNYILEEDELLQVFRLVNNYLDPGGIFIFDMNTPYKYETLLADNTFAENREEGSFIWENYFDAESGINEYDLTLFVRDSDNRFMRFAEEHYQKSYSAKQVCALLQTAGMELVAVYDGYTKNPLREDSDRMTIIAREKGKKEQN